MDPLTGDFMFSMYASYGYRVEGIDKERDKDLMSIFKLL